MKFKGSKNARIYCKEIKQKNNTSELLPKKKNQKNQQKITRKNIAETLRIEESAVQKNLKAKLKKEGSELSEKTGQLKLQTLPGIPYFVQLSRQKA